MRHPICDGRSHRMRATVIAGALLALVAMQSTWVDGAGASSIAGRHPVTSTTTPPTPVQACLQTTLTLGRPHVGSALKLAVCNDVVKDLIGIGQRFGLQVITPSTAANNPMTMIYTSGSDTNGALADTQGVLAGSSNAPCVITLYPSGYQGGLVGTGVSFDLHDTLSHEVVHCYQNLVIESQSSGSLSPFDTEGSATYFGDAYAVATQEPSPGWIEGWFSRWQSDNATGLENIEPRNAYEAVGWYAVVALHTGSSLWSKTAAAWRADLSGGGDAFIHALGGDSSAVEQAWGPSLLNKEAWGAAWQTPGIGVPNGTGLSPLALALGPTNPSQSTEIQPWAGYAAVVESAADGFVDVSITGGYAAYHETGASATGVTHVVFCVGKQACDDASVECGPHEQPVLLPELTAPTVLTATSESEKAQLVVTWRKPPAAPSTPVILPANDAACNPTTPGGGGGGGGGGDTGYSEGDPHLQTLNGATYDFQGAGEYTLVRSANGKVVVQVREQPAPGSNSVAWDTAIAMLVDGTRLEIDPGASPSVLVNGRRVRLHGTSPLKLAGGGTVHFDADADVIVTWPGGSTADVFADTLGENITFTAAPDLLGHLTGLLTAIASSGSRTKSSGDITLIGGNGRRYTLDPNTKAGFKMMYAQFAPTWQIDKHESLFTYAHGKSTRSYIVKGFPSTRYGASALGELLQQLFARLDQICRQSGVTSQALLDDCMLDLNATGTKNAALLEVIAHATARTGESVQSAEAEAVALPVTPPTPTTTTTTTTTTTLPPASVTVPLGAGGVLPVASYDASTDTTDVVWPTSNGSAIELCVIHATAPCNGTGTPIMLTDAAAGAGSSVQYGSPQVVIMPGTNDVVVVANVDNVAGSQEATIDPSGYTGVSNGDVAWSSPPGGGAFSGAGQGLAFGGKFLAANVPPISGAAALSSSTIAVFANNTMGSDYADFTLTSPAPVTPVNPSPSGNFSQAPDADNGDLATIPATSPGGNATVVGLALGASRLSCPSSALTNVGWGAAAGGVAPTSASGSLDDQASWPKSDFKLLTCAANSMVLASGLNGIGELDQEGPGLAAGGKIALVYRTFEPAANSFGDPVEVADETNVSTGGADEVSLAQDAAGDLFATWADSRGLVVSTSTDAGKTWSSPLATGLGNNDQTGNYVVEGIGNGAFEVAYTKGVSDTTSREYLTTFTIAGIEAAAHPTLSPGDAQVSNLVHHPCELVTEHELDDIAGVSYAPGSPVASAKNDYSYCDYAPLNPERQTGVNLIVSTGSVASALPPKSFGNTYYSVGSVGHDATYVVEKGAAKGYGELFFELGTIGSTTINVQIQMFHGSLSEGAEIAKQCLANL